MLTRKFNRDSVFCLSACEEGFLGQVRTAASANDAVAYLVSNPFVQARRSRRSQEEASVEHAACGRRLIVCASAESFRRIRIPRGSKPDGLTQQHALQGRRAEAKAAER